MADAQAKAMINITKQHFANQFNEGFTTSEALIYMYLATNLPTYK
jgi:hypothetical protein